MPGRVLTVVLEKELPGYQGKRGFLSPIWLSLILDECRKKKVEKKSTRPVKRCKVGIRPRARKGNPEDSNLLLGSGSAPSMPSLLGNQPEMFLLYSLGLESKKDPEAANIEELEKEKRRKMQS